MKNVRHAPMAALRVLPPVLTYAEYAAAGGSPRAWRCPPGEASATTSRGLAGVPSTRSDVFQQCRRRTARGFTLLEVGIAIFLLALFLGVVVPGFGALSGAELKKTTGIVGGLVRDTYARAALAGRSYRVVFDLEEQSYWVEESEGVARASRERQALERDGKAQLDKLDDRVVGLEESRDEEDKEKLRLLTGPGFKPVEDEGGKHAKMPSDVRFKSVWVEHLERAATGGQVALHFFPGGWVEEAHITLTDDDQGDRTLTIVVNPLTGEVEVVDEEPRIPEAE